MSLKDKIAAQKKQIADSRASWHRPYKFPVGTTYIRIQPGVGETQDEREDFAVDYGAAWIKDPRDSSKLLAVVGDAEICYGRPDPVRQAITEYIHKCNERGDEAGSKAAKDWLGRKAHLMNIEIVGGADKENVGKNVIWEASDNQYDSVLSCVLNVLEADQDPFDLNTGLVIQVDRVGTGVQDTKYTFQAVLAANKYPGTQAARDSRVDLKAYRDGKFGVSVTKALGVMSNLLGYDVATTALGSALASSAPAAALGAPAANTPAVQAAAAAAAPASEASDTELLSELADVADAEFEPVVEAAAPEQASNPAPVAAAPAPAPASDVADIMAELDAL